VGGWCKWVELDWVIRELESERVRVVTAMVMVLLAVLRGSSLVCQVLVVGIF